MAEAPLPRDVALTAVTPLALTREQILAHRRRVGALDERLPMSADALRMAAWAGLQDSMPRAALLSIHARVEAATPDTWGDGSLVQLWGPRFSVYVVAAEDVAYFSLGRYPDDGKGQANAEDAAARLAKAIGRERVQMREAARRMNGPHHNWLRYAAPTGTVLIRWEGARSPMVWIVPRPPITPREALLELARRYLHVFGPTRPDAFAKWAGISSRQGPAAFKGLASEVIGVRTPVGDEWILASDEASLRSKPGEPAPARLLPSGDAFYLLQGADRELLVPDPKRRSELWTTRVWPGALLVRGDVVGVWRRDNLKLSIEPWRTLSTNETADVEAEAAGLPLPGAERGIQVRWAA